MACTPFLISAGPRVTDTILERKDVTKQETQANPSSPFTDHIIIVGFGLNGQDVARTAKLSAIPYVIIEMNAETVKSEKALGEPIFYGDATEEEVLAHANIQSARIILIVISDPGAMAGSSGMPGG